VNAGDAGPRARAGGAGRRAGQASASAGLRARGPPDPGHGRWATNWSGSGRGREPRARERVSRCLDSLASRSCCSVSPPSSPPAPGMSRGAGYTGVRGRSVRGHRGRHPGFGRGRAGFGRGRAGFGRRGAGHRWRGAGHRWRGAGLGGHRSRHGRGHARYGRRGAGCGGCGAEHGGHRSRCGRRHAGDGGVHARDGRPVARHGWGRAGYGGRVSRHGRHRSRFGRRIPGHRRRDSHGWDQPGQRRRGPGSGGAPLGECDPYLWPGYDPDLDFQFDPTTVDPSAFTVYEGCNASQVAGTITSGWWSFIWGHDRNPQITDDQIRQVLAGLNEDLGYIRDEMGWPPDDLAQDGHYSSVYLYGSGLCTDNASNTETGGWQSNIGPYAMVLSLLGPDRQLRPAAGSRTRRSTPWSRARRAVTTRRTGSTRAATPGSSSSSTRSGTEATAWGFSTASPSSRRTSPSSATAAGSSMAASAGRTRRVSVARTGAGTWAGPSITPSSRTSSTCTCRRAPTRGSGSRPSPGTSSRPSPRGSATRRRDT
jgi:hypothetical protein